LYGEKAFLHTRFILPTDKIMKAMLLTRLALLRNNQEPLELQIVPEPEPAGEEILIKVSVCGVCHTELDEIEGRTPPARLPMILGHQIIGRVHKKGEAANRFNIGDRVGAAWIFSSCGKCVFCKSGRENLCEHFKATGRDVDGGYAEFMTIKENFAYRIPENFSDEEAAPLLCAGAIGYRSLRLTGIKDGQILGLTGFGASAHIVIQLAKHSFPNSKVFVFARSKKDRDFAAELGAVWAGKTEDKPPELLDAIIEFTPAWKPIVEAMRFLKPGGRLVINAIRKEDDDKDQLTKLDYSKHLWMEKEIKSAANVTRADVEEFLEIAAAIPIRPEVREFPLEEANRALVELKQGRARGAKVLRIG
jgi:propanol-preferring alcohol dehydrogenase